MPESMTAVPGDASSRAAHQSKAHGQGYQTQVNEVSRTRMKSRTASGNSNMFHAARTDSRAPASASMAATSNDSANTADASNSFRKHASDLRSRPKPASFRTRRDSSPGRQSLGNSARVSMPMSLSSSYLNNTSSRGFGNGHDRTTSGDTRSNASATSDAELLHKFEEVNSEIDRLVRASHSDPSVVDSTRKQVKQELNKARRSSNQMIQSQKDLLKKIEKHEHSKFRRMFTINRDTKMEKLKSKLCDKLSQSVRMDEELERLERKSDALSRTSFDLGASTSSISIRQGLSGNNDEISEELSWLEKEKQDILTTLFNAMSLPDVHALHTRVSMFSSEAKACDSIRRQVDQATSMYRQALQLLRTAMSTVVSPEYTGTVKEFVVDAYPMALEAGQLIEQASHLFQPESRRRYGEFAPEVMNVRPPKFPQAVTDFARRQGTAAGDMRGQHSIEGMRKLHTAEYVIILMHRTVIEKLEVLEKWRKQVETDLEKAESMFQKLDSRMHEKIASLAKNVSA